MWAYTLQKLINRNLNQNRVRRPEWELSGPTMTAETNRKKRHFLFLPGKSAANKTPSQLSQGRATVL